MSDSPIVSTDPVIVTAQNVADVLANGEGLSFTCDEAEVIHRFITALGRTADANRFMAMHADTDIGDGDMHAPDGDLVEGWRYT